MFAIKCFLNKINLYKLKIIIFFLLKTFLDFLIFGYFSKADFNIKNRHKTTTKNINKNSFKTTDYEILIIIIINEASKSVFSISPKVSKLYVFESPNRLTPRFSPENAKNE